MDCPHCGVSDNCRNGLELVAIGGTRMGPEVGFLCFWCPEILDYVACLKIPGNFQNQSGFNLTIITKAHNAYSTLRTPFAAHKSLIQRIEPRGEDVCVDRLASGEACPNLCGV